MMSTENNSEKSNWYALYTKPKHEFKAKTELHSVSIECYLPTIIVTKRWSDRKKKIEEPVFKGYIFINVNEKERLIALQQSAIVSTICFQGKPSIIPEWEIENLKKILSSNPEIFISDKIVTGTKVKIIDGPFRDVIGVVTEYKKGENYLAVSIDLLQRSVLVRLPQESIIKIMEH